VLSTELGWRGPFWTWMDGLDFEQLGLGIVVLFVGSWLVALVIYRVKHYEQIGFGPPAGPENSGGTAGEL